MFNFKFNNRKIIILSLIGTKTNNINVFVLYVARGSDMGSNGTLTSSCSHIPHNIQLFSSKVFFSSKNNKIIC